MSRYQHTLRRLAPADHTPGNCPWMCARLDSPAAQTTRSCGVACWSGAHTRMVSRTRVLAALSIGVTGVALALGACSSTSSRSKASGSNLSPTDAISAIQTDFVDVVNKVRPSVVEITTATGLGSGVVYDSKGDIVTNDHVVGQAKNFQVSLFDGQVLSAKLVGAFPPMISLSSGSTEPGGSLQPSSPTPASCRSGTSTWRSEIPWAWPAR